MTRLVRRTERLALLSGPLLVAWLAVCTPLSPVGGAETNANSASGTTSPDNASLQRVLRICAALQEQIRATQRALDEARAEAKSSSKTAAETIAELTNQLAHSRNNEAALKQAGEAADKQSRQAAGQLALALADLQKALATGQQAEQHSAALAQSNAVLGHDLERARVAGTALEKTREKLDQRLAALAAELGQVKGALQEEVVRRRVLEQQTATLLASNVDLTLQLARRIETEAGLRGKQEKLERRLEESTNRFAEVRSLMQQAQDHLEERARDAESALAQVRADLARERQETSSELAADRRRHRLGLGSALVFALAIAGCCWLRTRRLRRLNERGQAPDATRDRAPQEPPAPRNPTPAAAPQPGAALQPSSGNEEDSVPAPLESPKNDKAKADTTAASDPGKHASVQGLIRKGLGLLNEGQAEAALTCFDEALALDPENSGTLVKRGTALERLDRTQEAISSYERAIGLNKCLTMAYLLKGAALLRLNRHEEAAESYRLAVTTQQAAARSPSGEPGREKA